MELRFLEIGVDPDFGKRADSHQALPRDDVVAGVDVAAGDDAVDLGHHVAVAEIQLGFVEIAAGLQQLGLGQLERRHLRDDLREDVIDVSFRIALVEFFDQLFRLEIVGRRDESQGGDALQQFSRGLADGGERLVEIGGHVAQFAVLRLFGQSQADADLVDLLQRYSIGRLVLIDVLFADRPRLLLQIEGPLVVGVGAGELGHVGPQQGDLVVHVLDGALQLEACGTRLANHGANVVAGHVQIRFGDVVRCAFRIDRNLVWFSIEPYQRAALADAVVVIDQHADDLAWHAGGDERDMAVDVGIVRGDRIQGAVDVRKSVIISCRSDDQNGDRTDDRTATAGEVHALPPARPRRRLFVPLRRQMSQAAPRSTRCHWLTTQQLAPIANRRRLTARNWGPSFHRRRLIGDRPSSPFPESDQSIVHPFHAHPVPCARQRAASGMV